MHKRKKKSEKYAFRTFLGRDTQIATGAKDLNIKHEFMDSLVI